MKLKRWLEIILIIVSMISGMLATYNVEISIIPFMLGGTIFVITTSVLCKYGTLYSKLNTKIEEFCNR